MPSKKTTQKHTTPKARKVTKPQTRKGRASLAAVETGYKFSNKTRAAMAKAHTGKKLSEATKQKIRDARAERKKLIELGLLQPFKHTEETRKLLKRLARKRNLKPSKQARLNSIRTRSTKRRDRLAEKAAKRVLRGET